MIKGKYTGMLGVTKGASFRQVGDKVYPVVDIVYPPSGHHITLPRTFIVLAMDDPKVVSYKTQMKWDMKSEVPFWNPPSGTQAYEETE